MQQVFQIESRAECGKYRATVVANSREAAIAAFCTRFNLKDDRAIRNATPISFGDILIVP